MTDRKGDGWQTPDHVLDRVRLVAPIKLDPCTYRDNPTGAEYIRTIDCDPDGLATEWHTFGGLVFCNPPYGRGFMRDWSAKIVGEAALGCEIVSLVRGDPSTSWAHAMLRSCALVCFPPRLRFKGATGSPDFANMLVYHGENGAAFRSAFEDLGPILRGEG